MDPQADHSSATATYVAGLLDSAIAASASTAQTPASRTHTPPPTVTVGSPNSFHFQLVSATPHGTRSRDDEAEATSPQQRRPLTLRVPPPLPRHHNPQHQQQEMLLPEVFVETGFADTGFNPCSHDSESAAKGHRLSASGSSSAEGGLDPLGGFASGASGRRSSRFVLRPRSDSQSSFSAGGLLLTDLGQSLMASRRASMAVSAFQNVGVVLPGKLYLTAAKHAFDADEMRGADVEAFLCVAGELSPPFPDFANPEHCLHLKLKDNASTQLADYIPAAMDFVDRQNEEGRAVVLYCQAGKSRSASIAVAFLMRALGMDADSALQELRLGYAKADPNTFFMVQLLNSTIGQEAVEESDESFGR